MINNTTPIGALFARSMAVNSPLIGGACAIVAGMFTGAWWFHQETDKQANNRAFMRSIAKSTTVSHELLLFFQVSKDAVSEALSMIRNPETTDDIRSELRSALSVSL